MESPAAELPTEAPDTNGRTDLAAEQPEPEVPQGPVVVSEVDRLKAENLNLKLLNLINKETILQQQIADLQNRQLPELQRERQAMNEQMAMMRVDIEQRYKINLTTHHIKPDDGTVIPRNPGMNPQAVAALQKMQAQLRG